MKKRAINTQLPHDRAFLTLVPLCCCCCCCRNNNNGNSNSTGLTTIIVYPCSRALIPLFNAATTLYNLETWRNFLKNIQFSLSVRARARFKITVWKWYVMYLIRSKLFFDGLLLMLFCAVFLLVSRCCCSFFIYWQSLPINVLSVQCATFPFNLWPSREISLLAYRIYATHSYRNAMIVRDFYFWNLKISK